MRLTLLLVLLAMTLIHRLSPGLFAVELDMSGLRIPAGEIRGGGPPKDGIPSLTDPRMTPAEKATYLQPSDLVLGVEMDGEARAYPLSILSYHEAVNDRIGGQPISVTY